MSFQQMLLGSSRGFIPDATLHMKFAENMYRGATPAELTVSRALTSYAEDTSGNWISFASGVPRITNRGLLVEETRTNNIRNNSGQGAVPGTPGTSPTNWGSGTNGSGASWSVVGTGVENGIDYVDLRLSGTVTVTNEAFFFMETTTGIAALDGQTWTGSLYGRVISESLGSLSSFTTGISSRIAGGAAGTWQARGTNQIAAARAATRLSQTRLTVTGTIADASTAFIWPLFYIVPSLGPFDAVVRIGWPQLEQGAFATSPIRTTSVAVTRPSEQNSLLGTAFSSWYTNAAAGTVYVETTSANSSSNGFLADITDGTSANGIGSYFSVNGTFLTHLVNAGGVTQAAPFLSGLTLGSPVKTALAFAANDMRAVYNGTLMTPDTSNTVPTVNRLHIGRRGDNTFYLNGYIRDIAYVPRSYSNAELQALTAL